MKRNEINETEIVIDIRRLFRALLKFSWLIVATGLIAGLLMFAYTTNYVTPKYASSVMLYVNNKSLSVSGSISITAADLSASQSLIDTYIAILNNRTTMEEVIERSDIDYTPEQLRGMISSKKLEGTEIFTVTVTADDPYEAAHIANSISEVLPHRVEDIIDGSSMRIVDSAVVQPGKISPNITQKTAIGFVFGCALAAALIVLITMFDDTIRDEDYLSDNYPLPILSCIPDLNGTASNDKYKYGYAQSHQQGRRDE